MAEVPAKTSCIHFLCEVAHRLRNVSYIVFKNVLYENNVKNIKDTPIFIRRPIKINQVFLDSERSIFFFQNITAIFEIGDVGTLKIEPTLLFK